MVTGFYSLAPLALDDLDDIHAYAEDLVSADAADQLIDALYDAFETIAGSPGLGHRRPDLTGHEVFFWTALKRYAVIYRKASVIEIVRVIPWARMEPVLLTPAGGLWL